MTASIVLTGLAANNPTPGTFVEINFAQGAAAGDSSPRSILVLANKSTTGTATPDTVIYGPDTLIPLQSEAQMIALGGPGSEAHRMFRRISKVNHTTSVYWVFVTESVGANATGTITLVGNATANGTLRVWIGDEFVDTAITSGDTITTIAANVSANINGITWWPATASPAVGVITLTAKNKGLRGNWIRFMTLITSSGAITTTATGSTDSFFTGGTTADSNVTALATVLPKKFYYIVSAAEDATQLGAVASQVNTQALPTTGLRQRVIGGSVDTISNATTIATGINAPRCEIVWQEKSPFTPAELAANQAAIVTLNETAPNPKTNFIGYGNDTTSQLTWKVPRSRVDSAAVTVLNIISALNNGLSPIGVNPNGTTYLVNRITSRSLSGATVDYRIRAAHKVTICDYFGDDLQAKLALQNAGKRIGDDPPSGARPPGGNVVTPRIVKGQIFGLINTYDLNDLLQNVPDIKTGTIVQRGTNPTTRMECRIPLQPCDNLEQTAVAVDQVA